MKNRDRAAAFFRALETRDGTALGFYAADVVQREFPNRLVPNGATRDLTALAEAGERGKRAVSRESYEIVNAVEQDDALALEVLWTGILAVDVGALTAGSVLRAHFGVFFRFRAGLIISQHNYDCFEP